MSSIGFVGVGAPGAVRLAPARLGCEVRFKAGGVVAVSNAQARVARRTAWTVMAEKFKPGLGKVAQPKQKLEPEVVFFEGKPAWTELIIPAITTLTVIGIIPFIAAAARQFWVRYKVTSRRVSIDGGFQGKDHVEIVYRDVESMKYVRRMGGGSADLVIFLKDGARLELRSVPDFKNIYNFILDQLPESVREACQPLPN